MNPRSPQHNQQFHFIAKCQSIAANKGLDFSPSLLSQTDPYHLNQMLKSYSQKLIFFGETTAQKYLEQTLISTTKKLKEENLQNNIMMNHEKLAQQRQPVTLQLTNFDTIVIRKWRQMNLHQKGTTRWRNARVLFFQNVDKGYEDKSNTQRLSDIDKYYSQFLRICLPIKLIIQEKITHLKSIFIQYHQKKDRQFDNKYLYVIFADELFKVIHQNKQLNQVIIKGVGIIGFQIFIEKLRASKIDNGVQSQNISNDWKKDFNPQKPFKISINTQADFHVVKKKKTDLMIKDLLFFTGLFDQVSNMTANIVLGRWRKIQKWGKTFQKLLIFLKTTKKINIKIIKKGKSDNITTQFIPFVRSMVFGKLYQFTQIVELSFEKINFDPQVETKDYLAIQQFLSSLFRNNKVTNLQLYMCDRFPILPIDIPLESFDIFFTTFRKQYGFSSITTQPNPSLKHIKSIFMQEELQIDDRLFNQLQTCNTGGFNINLNNISPNTPSNIKYLYLNQFSFGNNINTINTLSIIFPKLFQLRQLQIDRINCGHQLVCMIPSPFLQILWILSSNRITDEGLQQIDKKWPRLNKLWVVSCRRITSKVWKTCKFQGLNQLKASKRMFGPGLQAMEQLQRRGISVVGQ